MKLSHFAVVQARGGASAMLDDPLVHCFDDKRVVLTYVSRQALMDYFRVPGHRRITLAQWNLVVDRNLDAFKRIIEAKYARGDWQVHNTLGQSLSVSVSFVRRCLSGSSVTSFPHPAHRSGHADFPHPALLEREDCTLDSVPLVALGGAAADNISFAI
jgi:hypothetical protein